MEGESGVIAAVAAGVAAYIEEEGQARQAMLRQPEPPLFFNPWGRSGREEMMRMRTLWQLRIVRR